MTPGRIAGLTEVQLRRSGLTRQKARYCRGLATCIVERKLELRNVSQLDDRAARSALIQVPGIGPWTADIYLLMALRRPDVWPDGDLALAKAAQRLKRLRRSPTTEKLRQISRAWTPWRAVAARLLWHAYLSSKKAAPAAKPPPRG